MFDDPPTSNRGGRVCLRNYQNVEIILRIYMTNSEKSRFANEILMPPNPVTRRRASTYSSAAGGIAPTPSTSGTRSMGTAKALFRHTDTMTIMTTQDNPVMEKVVQSW